ncbi:MAG: hypothetical protein DRQ88_12650 [Epsilonproteobacteria bacterium]|nr:MAG: hypothetical protein DRQ89_10925 [Campylobacterota bacterium]RLA63288.1 MAG: hypothetical protein DRQ88_12650 [Campylobacterota bacterium]
MKKLITLIIIGFSFAALSALPPRAQEDREISAIKKSKEARKLLGSRITSVMQTMQSEGIYSRYNVYEVKAANGCKTTAFVQYKSCGRAGGYTGPSCFDLRIGPIKACRAPMTGR